MLLLFDIFIMRVFYLFCFLISIIFAVSCQKNLNSGNNFSLSVTFTNTNPFPRGRDTLVATINEIVKGDNYTVSCLTDTLTFRKVVYPPNTAINFGGATTDSFFFNASPVAGIRIIIFNVSNGVVTNTNTFDYSIVSTFLNINIFKQYPFINTFDTIFTTNIPTTIGSGALSYTAYTPNKSIIYQGITYPPNAPFTLVNASKGINNYVDTILYVPSAPFIDTVQLNIVDNRTNELKITYAPLLVQVYSFRTNVFPLLADNCSSCHNSNAGNLPIIDAMYNTTTSYNSTLVAVAGVDTVNNILLKAIQGSYSSAPHNNGVSLLTTNQINIIQYWIQAGALNDTNQVQSTQTTYKAYDEYFSKLPK